MNRQEQIKKACEVLKNGGTIIYPTDTILGLGCDAANKDAVRKILDIKQREPSKSFIVLVSDEFMLDRIVVDIPEIAFSLIDVTDTPITIIYDKVDNVSEQVKAKDGSLGVRVVKQGISHDLIKQFKKPIVSTSVNFSGMPSALSINDIDQNILRSVDFILDSPEPHATGLPSKIIKVSRGNEIKIIRK